MINAFNYMSRVVSAKQLSRTKLVKLVMRTGEGAAISNAGTACVPARIKNTCRVIKNSL